MTCCSRPILGTNSQRKKKGRLVTFPRPPHRKTKRGGKGRQPSAKTRTKRSPHRAPDIERETQTRKREPTLYSGSLEKQVEKLPFFIRMQKQKDVEERVKRGYSSIEKAWLGFVVCPLK